MNDDQYTKLETKVKRGEGTRDQDTTKVVTRHPNPKTAVKNHKIAVYFHRQMVNEAPEMQPEALTEVEDEVVRLVESMTENSYSGPVSRGDVMIELFEQGVHPETAEDAIIEALMDGRIANETAEEWNEELGDLCDRIMTEVRDGERILRDHIYELAAHGLIANETAEDWNEELEDFCDRIRDGYDPENHD